MGTAPPLWMLRAAFRTVGTVAPGVAARWAESIFCRPPRNEPRATEEAFLATGSPQIVQSENQDLAVWVWGSGPVVILAHGWGSRAGRFSSLARALSDNGFKVVLFDAPAHGASKGDQASLPQFSHALRAVADTVGPAYGLVGHSLGGAAVSLAMGNGLLCLAGGLHRLITADGDIAMELAVYGIDAIQVSGGGLNRRNLLLANELAKRRGGEERYIGVMHVGSFHAAG